MKFDPDSGNQYAVVSMTVENTGKTSASFLPTFSMNEDVSAKIIYNKDYEYSATQLLGYDLDLHDSSLNPLTSKSGNIAFEVPAAVVTGSESIVIVFSQGDDSIEFTLR